MRWLCNENIPRTLVEALRKRDHDVVWIREISPGISDVDVLVQAVRERRICLTFDKDFGELAAATPLPAGCGVVLLRIRPPASSVAAAEIASVLAGRKDWAGHFSVLDPGRIRMRPLPD
ncbi:MAG: DUF5615 family PIN-like protein [Reyranella sp.]